MVHAGDRVQTIVRTPRRRLSAEDRFKRRRRVFARLHEGWAYQEIARQEGLTARRIRQIVSEVLQQRALESLPDPVKRQLARLAPAVRVAPEAIADGDRKAIARFLKVLDRLDRCHTVAYPDRDYDDAALNELLAKIDRVGSALETQQPAETVAEGK
jgi:transcriptional regulator with XRE-family HTH domain